jgi:prepilin-type processing-associated H-X9-DG protein/prepilin-type N-terminal cleavage/methylation domain-containing protein
MDRIAVGGAKRAFTIIELLVVIAIISILAGMLLPALGSARVEARSAMCISNLKNIGVAFAMYTNANNGLYPSVRWKTGVGTRWITAIAPYLGGGVEDPTNESSPATGNQIVNNVLRCPEIGSSAYQIAGVNRGDYARTGSYGYNWMTFGPFYPMSPAELKRHYPVSESSIAAPASTILVADAFGEKGMTGQPHAYTLDPPVNLQGRWGASNHGSPLQCPADPRHNGRFNALFADGHVQTLTMEEAGYDSNDPTGVGGTGNPALWNGLNDPTVDSF